MNEYIEHHGVKGQRWGIRRYQNEDGTLTEEGKQRLQITGPKKAVLSVEEDEYKRSEIMNKGAMMGLSALGLIGAGLGIKTFISSGGNPIAAIPMALTTVPAAAMVGKIQYDRCKNKKILENIRGVLSTYDDYDKVSYINVKGRPHYIAKNKL